MLNFSYRSEFDALFLCVVAFVFVWSGSSMRGRLVRSVCVSVCLRVGTSSFVVFLFLFDFLWLRSQMDEWVSWLPKPILVLLEGGAA